MIKGPLSNDPLVQAFCYLLTAQSPCMSLTEQFKGELWAATLGGSCYDR